MMQKTIYAKAFRLQTALAHPLALSLRGHSGRKTFQHCKLLSLLLSNNPAGRNAAMVPPNPGLSHLCLLPPFYSPLLFPRLLFPHSSLLGPDAQDRPGYQRTKHTSQVNPNPISTCLCLSQVFILAGGLYSHQTLRPVTAAPQDEVS